MAEEKIGSVMKFFKEPSVAAISIRGNLKVGDKIRIKGAHTDFTQTVDSMQIEHDSVDEVNEGDDVGIKVKERVRPNDEVFKVTEEDQTEEPEK